MYAIDDLSLHIDNMSTCEEEQEQQDTEYKETDKCEKKTLRQKLKELEAKEATEDELKKLEIVKRALMLKEEKDEINIMKIFPKSMLSMQVFTNEHAIQTITELIKLYDDRVLESMPFICEALQRLLMKTRGIYTRKEYKSKK